MNELEIAVFAAAVFAFALVSRRLQKLDVTAPMVFILAGVLIGSVAVPFINEGINNEFLLLIGELALVLVLFTDASRVNLTALRKNAPLNCRKSSNFQPVRRGQQGQERLTKNEL